MSQWTHVCGVIRFDDMRKAIVKPGFEAIAAERFKLELPKPPTGSEGPLIVTWTHGQGEHESYNYMSTATIIGDLRDFGLDELPALEQWWKQATTDLPQLVMVRAGILQVDIEYHEPTIVWQVATP